jgi:hypothetical protein
MTSLFSFPHRFTRLCAGLALAACALFTTAGCDSLEVENPNAPQPDVVSLQALATGLEGGMRAGMGVYWQVTGIFGRELYYFEPADPRYTGELYTGPLDPGGFLLLTPWSGRYGAVGQARTLLDEAAARGLSDQALAGVRGYANTIIAYQLLLNLNYLDDNGIKIEYSDDVSTPFVSREAAFEEIDRLLDAAAGDLANAGDSFPFTLVGLPNTPADFAEFNQAIQARVAIYRGNADAALAALDASFIDAGGDLDDGVYYVYSAGSGDRLNPIFEPRTADFVKLRATPFFVNGAEAGDQRVANKVLERDDLTGGASPGSANGLASNYVLTVTSSSTSPYPIIRNEELLLIRAEANILNGDYDAAEDDINIVRNAAGLDDVELDASNAIDQLLYERRYSLFAEGHRWVDLRRYDRLDTLPQPEVGDGITSQIFEQWPRPNSEVPG